MSRLPRKALLHRRNHPRRFDRSRRNKSCCRLGSTRHLLTEVCGGIRSGSGGYGHPGCWHRCVSAFLSLPLLFSRGVEAEPFLPFCRLYFEQPTRLASLPSHLSTSRCRRNIPLRRRKSSIRIRSNSIFRSFGEQPCCCHHLFARELRRKRERKRKKTKNPWQPWSVCFESSS
jgi:hypothetical protein